MQMQTQQEDIISNVTIVGVALACVLTIVFNSGTFTLWSMLEGAVLLLLLLAYSKHGDASQTHIQHLLTSALFALSSLIFLGWLLQPLHQTLGLAEAPMIVIEKVRLAITWPVFAFVFWLIATFIWMRLRPRRLWPRFFQMAFSK